MMFKRRTLPIPISSSSAPVAAAADDDGEQQREGPRSEGVTHQEMRTELAFGSDPASDIRVELFDSPAPLAPRGRL
ncbi:hypothetical protein ACFX1Q_040073 [Malus domestica]